VVSVLLLWAMHQAIMTHHVQLYPHVAPAVPTATAMPSCHDDGMHEALH
jgi:hypothetical protein